MITINFSSLHAQGVSVLCSLFVVANLLAFSAKAQSEEATMVNVAKTSGCGCCVAWIDHLEQHGFSVSSRNMAMGRLMQYKVANGISPQYASCHTAKVGGYTIEGHVPAKDIRKLLKEMPDAVGLSVPEMPLGSPGMDVGSEKEAFDVLLVLKDGSSKVFASYPARQ